MSANPHTQRTALASVFVAAALLLPATPAFAGTARNRIHAVDAGESGGDTTIAIRGNRTPTFTVYKLSRPSRVVIDIASSELQSSLAASDGSAAFSVNSWAVSEVSAHALDGSQSVVRVVVRMARPGSYKVKAVGNDVVVKVAPRDAPPVNAGVAQAADAERARQDAKRARAEADSARKAAATARASAKAAAAKADREVKQAQAASAKAKTAADAARASAEKAQREANDARSAAEKAQRQALVRERDATQRMKDAQAVLDEADRRLGEARVLKRKADAKAKDARALLSAAEAKAAGAKRDAAASKAEAKRLAAEAAAAVKDGRRDANALSARAEKAAAKAERQRVAAVAAAKAEETRRAEAESAAKSAAERGKSALSAAKHAEQERARADALRTKAERAAAKAIAQRAAADKRAAAAEKRAASHASAAAEAETRATKATKTAASMRAQRDAANDRAAAAEKKVAQVTAQGDEARAEAARLRDRNTETEARLTRVKRQAASSKAEVARLNAERDRTNREIARLEAEKSELRAQREADRKSAEARIAAAETKAARTPERAAKKKSAVRDVDYVDAGKYARVIINLDGPVKPKVLSATGRKAILEIPRAAIDKDVERTLDTSRFGGPITAVSSYRDPRSPDKVRIVVDLAHPVTSTLKRKGTMYYWDFDKPATAARPANKRSRPATAPARPRRSASGIGSSTPITNQTVAQSRQRKVYRGRKIDLDFKDADIHNLLRLLADVGGVNIVIPDEIRASVTVRLRNVPWDQALEVILQSKGLWYRREGSLIRVAPRKLLDAEDKAEAERRAAVTRSEAPEPEIFTLNYAVASEIRPRLAPLLSPKGRIEVDKRTNALIVNDIKAHRRRIIDLVRRLDTQTPQIQIEARIVEARTTFRHEFGIQWGGNSTASAATGNATGLVFPNSISVAGAADDNNTNDTGVNAAPSDFAVNLPAAIGSGSGGGLGFAFGSVGGNFNLNLRLTALEDTGEIRIISAPKITTLNNVKASIKQGVSIPISVISASGTQTQFVQANLALEVTPHVSERDCSVAMELKVTKNEADFANTGARGDPSILTKEAVTTVLVRDGETSVIGGIYTRATGWSKSKVPFFGDLPVIGVFFRNRSESDDRTEVLVFITPKITNRAFLRCE